MIKYRASYSAILAILLLIFGFPAYIAFGIGIALELLMSVYVFYIATHTKSVPSRSLPGLLITQYVNGLSVDPIEIIHIAGGHVLAGMLATFGGWAYIPAALIFILSSIDVVKTKRRPK